MLPELYHLGAVRKLRGDALVTYPGADLTKPRVERVRTIDRGSVMTPYGTPDVDYSSATLTDQHISGGDQNAIEVYQLFETLPGVEIIKPGFEPETNAAMRTITQRVDMPATLIAIGATRTFDAQTFYCVDCDVEPDSGVAGTLRTVYMKLPSSYSERSSRGFQFPAVFTIIMGWAVGVYQGSIQPPWAGVHFSLFAHRTATKPALVTHTFSLGPSEEIEDTWAVDSPGRASRIFRIGDNTIHNAILVIESVSGTDYTVEDLPASTPASYVATDVLIIEIDERPWNRAFYRKSTVSICELETPS